MNERTKERARSLLVPAVAALRRMNVAPTVVTLAGLPFAAAAGWLFAAGRFVGGGVALGLVGICDTLDGELARTSGRKSETGAFIDSTVDRLSEGLVLGGIFWYYRSNSGYGLAAFAALFFSLMVSYIRARAEGVGRDCRVGLFERPVRVFLLLVGAFVLGRTYMPLVLVGIAAGSLGTSIHRFIHVVRQQPRSS